MVDEVTLVYVTTLKEEIVIGRCHGNTHFSRQWRKFAFEGDKVLKSICGTRTRRVADIVTISAISLAVVTASLYVTTVCAISISGSAQSLPPTTREIWLKRSPAVDKFINLPQIWVIFALGMQHTLVLVNLFGSILRTRLLPNTKQSFGVLDVKERSVNFGFVL